MTDVFITGLGVVSPVGNTTDAYWQSLLSDGTSPEIVYDQLEDRIPNRYVYMHKERYENLDCEIRSTRFCSDAVSQALAEAGLSDPTDFRCGVMVGTTMGDEHHPTELDEAAAAQAFPFQISAKLAQEFGLYGPNLTVSNACTSGLYCIDLAAAAIRRGEADIIVAGGVESASEIVLSCFNRLGALDDGLCRPFDKKRQGTVLGEGAAFVVLESAESVARRKHRHIYGVYKGSGWSCDAYQTTAPAPDGEQIMRALEEALQSSEVSANEIQCVLPHGTGTPLNDSLEMQVLDQMFGESAEPPTLTAIKSRLGHSGGASGAFSVLTACLILQNGKIPTTVNLDDPESALSIPVSLVEPTELKPDNILVNAYAFGGNNISIVLGQA